MKPLKQFFISTLGTITGFWISIMLFVLTCVMLMVCSMAQLISGATGTSKVSKNSVLCIELTGNIEEVNSEIDFVSLLQNEELPQSLTDIISAIAAAKDDDRIEGILIKANGAAAGIATREAIREELVNFKESGKWVVAYGESYGQGDYYIASMADEVIINPYGLIELRGLTSGIPYFKSLLDKVGVEMQVVKVGTFKSAVEPYTLTEMSEANRLQTETYLNNIWDKLASDICRSRNISKADLNQLADSMIMFSPTQTLVESKLVDKTQYYNEFRDYICEKSGNSKDDDDDLSFLISVKDYLKSGVDVPNTKDAKRKIAVYYAAGDITESGRNGIASDRVVPDLLNIAEDDEIDALVLRVNSGGGSAFASEQIWHAVELVKEAGKKVYVSMGDYAASGGYYISCGADKIYAMPTTLTGSIGIFGMIPCFHELVSDKLGVNVEYVSTNANGAAPNSFYPMTPVQKAAMQRYVDNGYELFTKRCADGRHVPQDSIKAIAEGRVWDGQTALKLGLVDQLGTLDDAISDLAQESGWKDYQIVNYPEDEDNFWNILRSMSTEMRANAIKDELGPLYPTYMAVKDINEMDPLQTRMDNIIIF